MGDAGSLFVGSLLAGASLLPLFTPQSQSPLVPLALALTLIVPVGEAVFVSALRWMAGRKPTRGGIDHSSHRLVAIGFSERRSVLVLCLGGAGGRERCRMDGSVRRGGAARHGGARGRDRAGRHLPGVRADVSGERLRRARARAVQRAPARHADPLARGGGARRSRAGDGLLLHAPIGSDSRGNRSASFCRPSPRRCRS